MFKLLTLGILFYFLYRLVFKPNLIGGRQNKEQESEKIHKGKGTDHKISEEDGEYIDYEEVE